MIIAKIQVNGAIAETVYRKVIPAGIIGAQVEFDYDEDIWHGLHKTVVFKGAVTKDVVTDANIVTIPHEVVEKPFFRLSIGVYGVDADGNIAIPTLWEDIGAILDAADPSGDISTDPSLPVWAQIQAMIGNLDELETTARDNLVAAVNEVAQSGGGGGSASIAMRVDSGYIQYSNDNGKTWVNLIAEADLKGDKGDKGADGAPGAKGDPGTPGKDGTSITISGISESAADGGTNTVTFSDGNSLKVKNGSKGSTGADGTDGITPHIGDNGNWYLGATDTGKPSRGAAGSAGQAGKDGKSAYQYAQEGGYTGTEAEFSQKLAEEKFANPNALTFTGAVTGSYYGSAPVSVEIPSVGGNKGWTPLYDGTITIEEAVKTVTVSLLAPCDGMVDFIGYIDWTANANTENANDNISIRVGKAYMDYGRLGDTSNAENAVFQATVTSDRTYWGRVNTKLSLKHNLQNMMYGFGDIATNPDYENVTIEFFAKTYAGTITLQLYGR